MKKIVLVALLATCGLMGADSIGYIGASVGETELKTSIEAVNFESKKNNTHYTGTLGQYMGDNGRVSLSYTYVKPIDHVQHSDGASLAFDFIVPIVDNLFMVYAGPVIGYTRHEEEAMGIKLDLSGLHYGGQAGVIVRVMNNIEVEGGYRYLIETGSDTVLGVNVDADTLRMGYVGVNFRY